MAEWDDEQIEFIKEKVSEEGKQEDLMKGKDAAQVTKPCYKKNEMSKIPF